METGIILNQADIKNAWPQLASGITMLISSLVWPFLTKWYNNKTKQEKKKKTTTKYLQYLEEKKEELTQELNLQKNIINENLISTQECINIIQSKNMNFWSKRIEQNDFLTARIGIGNEKLAVEIEWQEEGFTISEDKLKKQIEFMKNKKNALWALLLMFLMPTVVGAQVAAFEEWAKNPSGELVEQDFAVAALDKVACERATEIVDSLWMKETAKRLYRTWENMTISHDSIKLSCAVRTFGMMPKDGRSLYISMHGGGNCPK